MGMLSLLKVHSLIQERLLGPDGLPRKVHEGEVPSRLGLVVEWIYGSIVSTATKDRDGAQRPLGIVCYEQLRQRFVAPPQVHAERSHTALHTISLSQVDAVTYIILWHAHLTQSSCFACRHAASNS